MDDARIAAFRFDSHRLEGVDPLHRQRFDVRAGRCPAVWANHARASPKSTVSPSRGLRLHLCAGTRLAFFCFAVSDR